MVCCNVSSFPYDLPHLYNVLISLINKLSSLNLAVIEATVRPSHHESHKVLWVERYLSYHLLCDRAHRVLAFRTRSCHVTSHRR